MTSLRFSLPRFANAKKKPLKGFAFIEFADPGAAKEMCLAYPIRHVGLAVPAEVRALFYVPAEVFWGNTVRHFRY